MRKSKKYSALEQGVIAGMIAVCCVQPALAGTQGSYMNSAGAGRAVDSVTYGGVAVTAASPYMQNPCARVDGGEAPPFNCGTLVKIPSTFPGKAYCQSQGLSLYRWSIQANAVNGATCDNPELERLINIIPANCASIEVSSSAVLTDDFSGLITVNAEATAGTALLLRAYEFPPGTTPQSLEELKAVGQLGFNLLLVGPFDLTEKNCNALKLPFTTRNGHENFYFVADTAAYSNPFTVHCPPDVVFQCGEAVAYPQVEVTGGCGEIENFIVTYDPPEAALPANVPTPVQVTVMDESGNIAQCSFTAVRQGILFDGFYSPIGGTGGTCDRPLRDVNRGSNVPVKFKAFCAGSPLTTGQPTFLIEQCSGGSYQGGGNFTSVANEWHFNWDTSGVKKGVYKLTATLQDGSKQYVFVRIK